MTACVVFAPQGAASVRIRAGQMAIDTCSLVQGAHTSGTPQARIAAGSSRKHLTEHVLAASRRRTYWLKSRLGPMAVAHKRTGMYGGAIEPLKPCGDSATLPAASSGQVALL